MSCLSLRFPCTYLYDTLSTFVNSKCLSYKLPIYWSASVSVFPVPIFMKPFLPLYLCVLVPMRPCTYASLYLCVLCTYAYLCVLCYLCTYASISTFVPRYLCVLLINCPSLDLPEYPFSYTYLSTFVDMWLSSKLTFYSSGWLSVWPDGYIIIQYLAIYNNDNLPLSIKSQSWFKSLPNTK